MEILGIDIGGTGIKGAPVNINTGELISERLRIETPQPSTPRNIAIAVKEIVNHFNWKGNIGCGFPAAIKNGVVKTATNIDKSWIGTDANKLFSEITGCAVNVINDADAAGLAEIHMGAGKDLKGTIFLVTVGTGIGTALFNNGSLLPNTELGHVKMGKMIAESYVSDAIRKSQDIGWKEWSGRFSEYLQYIEFLFWPDLIIIGGGISKKSEKYLHLLETKTKIVIARFQNNAGIIGAAAAAISMK